MITELAPARMVPVSVPPKIPVPDVRLRVTPVFATTLAAVARPTCAWTTTLKAVLTTGLTPPFTEVIAKCGGVVAMTRFTLPPVTWIDATVPAAMAVPETLKVPLLVMFPLACCTIAYVPAAIGEALLTVKALPLSDNLPWEI